MTTFVVHGYGTRKHAIAFPRPLAVLRAAWSLLRTWQYRADYRAELGHMDARMLSDIGLTRDQADREAAKPFWQA